VIKNPQAKAAHALNGWEIGRNFDFSTEMRAKGRSKQQ